MTWETFVKPNIPRVINRTTPLHAGLLTLQDILRICNIYCFPTATMARWTRLNCTSYAHCLSCSQVQYSRSHGLQFLFDRFKAWLLLHLPSAL